MSEGGRERERETDGMGGKYQPTHSFAHLKLSVDAEGKGRERGKMLRGGMLMKSRVLWEAQLYPIVVLTIEKKKRGKGK